MSGEVGRDEFEALKIRVTVMENAMHQLTQQVATVAENVLSLRDQVTEVQDRQDRLERLFLELRAQIDVQHAALMSAILLNRG